MEAGNAVADVVYGKVNPGGKLPVSFPRNVGQVPIYYNHKPTGRPCDVDHRSTTRVTATSCSCAPLYEFGYGLSYTTFSDLEPAAELDDDGRAPRQRHRQRGGHEHRLAGRRRGRRSCTSTIPVASISQPVRRLRGFERVTLQPGQTKTVGWTLDRDDVGFYDNRGRFVVENGRINVYVGNTSSQSDNKRRSPSPAGGGPTPATAGPTTEQVHQGSNV